MTARTRAKKPELPRRRPRRALSGALRAAPDATVQDSVGIGYQVIDAYIAQGRSAAQSRKDASPAPAPGGDAQRMTQRLLQYGAELANVGLELLSTLARDGQTAAPDAVRAGPFQYAEQAPAAQPTAAPGTTRILLSCRCERPVSIELALHPDAPGAGMIAHALRLQAPGKRRAPRLQVELTQRAGALHASVTVPPRAAAGVYRGALVRESDGVACGAIALTVHGDG